MWTNDIGAATGGIGVLLGPHAKKAFSSIQKFSDRVLLTNFEGNPKTSVIVTCSPTNVADETLVDQFYDDLRKAIDSVPMHNVLLVIGDFNARVGQDQTQFTSYQSTNRNGSKLLELLQEKSLSLCNTNF